MRPHRSGAAAYDPPPGSPRPRPVSRPAPAGRARQQARPHREKGEAQRPSGSGDPAGGEGSGAQSRRNPPETAAARRDGGGRNRQHSNRGRAPQQPMAGLRVRPRGGAGRGAGREAGRGGAVVPGGVVRRRGSMEGRLPYDDFPVVFLPPYESPPAWVPPHEVRGRGQGQGRGGGHPGWWQASGGGRGPARLGPAWGCAASPAA